MKTRFLWVLTGLTALATSVGAQTGVESETPFGHGEDSVRCITNISLFIPYAKAGNYQDAFPFWEKAYLECPGAHKDIYLHGARIFAWRIANENDAAKKNALIDDLMKMYDQRVKYFGNDRRYGTDWILGHKAQDYIQYKEENIDPKLLRDWLIVALDQYDNKTEPLTVALFVFASTKLLLQDASHKEQFIKDYMRSSAILDAQLDVAQTAKDSKTQETVKAYKASIDVHFAGSGAADCETLQNLYASKIEENQEDMDYLKASLALLKRVKCTEIDAYFVASRYVHVNEPTAESAIGLGKQAVRDKNFELAIRYLEEAASLEAEDEAKADDYYMIALLMFEQHSLHRARQYAHKVLEHNPNYGNAYLLMGNMYASSAKQVYPDDAVLARTVYYAAIDKFEKARQVDPSIADDARRLIATYHEYLPSTEDIFMHPELDKGQPFIVGGWINERVTVR
ncbi:MAG: hypothetical protein LBU03_03200 [Tannerellaceae bacterium]|jgi:hypothetical protein|nr:hypothetical protein [Tannerellaceae bacterium]